jgi:hypothetical protein
MSQEIPKKQVCGLNRHSRSVHFPISYLIEILEIRLCGICVNGKNNTKKHGSLFDFVCEFQITFIEVLNEMKFSIFETKYILKGYIFN